RIEAFNRGPDPAPLHILPHLWFRNTWAWGKDRLPEPSIRPGAAGAATLTLVAEDEMRARQDAPSGLHGPYTRGRRVLYAPAGGRLLFTDNETNPPRLAGVPPPHGRPFFKDAFHRHLIAGEDCTNPVPAGTRAAIHYAFTVPAGG